MSMGAALKLDFFAEETRRVLKLIDQKDALLERARVAIAESAALRKKIEEGIDETYRLLTKYGFADERLHHLRSP
jgi:hypothetical protein